MSSQFKKFEDIFTELFHDINLDQSNSIEIIDKIKTELEKKLPTVYKEWKNSEFDINFKFKLQNAAKKIVETTLLHTSVECEGVPCTLMVQYLLNKGADPNIQDSYGKTPLYVASFARDDENKEAVELLLEKKQIQI